MKCTRRLSQRMVRWTSLCVCLALVLSSFVLFPSQVSIGKNTRSGKPSANSGAQSNGQGRRVNPPTPQTGPPKAGLPNLDDLRRDADDSRRHGPREVHAPAPVPSRQRRWRHGSQRAEVSGRRSEVSKANHARVNRVRSPTVREGSADRRSAYPEPQGPDGFAMARIDPHNRTGTGGVDLLSNNFNWSLGLLGLKGRGGLDLGLSLSYNSLVWTRSGNYIKYDLDDSTVAPGFRLDFPVIEGPYWNDQAGTNFFLMVTPSGGRVELRYVGVVNTYDTYESQDSAHLQLQIDDSTHALVRPTDGTRMSFTLSNSFWRCNEIKDRNGNFLTITHNAAGDLWSVVDTLNRTITVTYDGNGNIQTVDQTWNGVVHHWATFGWGVANIGNNFAGMNITGPNNTSTPVLTQVGLPDGSYYTFEYTNGYGQVTTIRYNGGDARPLRYTTIAYSASGSDCPRVSEQHEWADWWSGMFTVPAEAVTYYAHDGDGGCRMTLPDGTVEKVYYGSTWKTGLTTETRSYATVADANANSWKKDTTTQWTQNNEGVSYFTNPRVIQTDILDIEGNHRKTTIDYGPSTLGYVQWGLPYLVREFATVGGTEIEFRQHYTDYNLSQQYLDRRIIGLVSAAHLTNVAWFQGKVTYLYDEAGQSQSTGTAIQHDPAFDTSTPRGNVTSLTRWDTTDPNTINDGAKKLTSSVVYDTNGSPVSSSDASGHTSHIYYTDSFSDNINHNTFAYPTTATDADGFSSTVKYNYDFGAATQMQSPLGASQTMTYDSAGRLSRTDNLVNGAYARWDYGSWVVTKSARIQDGAGENHTVTILDGFGRAVATGGDNPGSAGGSWARFYFTDVMGRPSTGTNPEEINGAWVPTGDDQAGWLWSTPVVYDWKGRPRFTYNLDGTYKEASYGGCGCAGGEVVTLTDEVGRKQKVYSDPLGRQWKAEVLNSDGSVYSTTENTFNARNQVTLRREFQGADTSSVYQDTTMTFDGYGRLESEHVPEQNSDAATTYNYNTDDTINSVTDARGASATYGYNNNRHLVSGITYSVPSGSGINVPAAVSFGYDTAGNLTSMNDGSGGTTYQYNSLSRIISETHQVNGLSANYTLAYEYNLAGELKTFTDQNAGTSVSYGFDSTGRLTGVTGTGFGNVTQLSSNSKYRAWGALSHEEYGNGTQINLNYNSRLQATHYALDGVKSLGTGQTLPEGADFLYYNDASLKFASNFHSDTLDSGIQDRAYGYDHAGRMVTAVSGTEARDLRDGTNSNVADGPFKQIYAHDAWDNMVSRTGRFWSQDDYVTASVNSHNRNSAWSYDADGNLLTMNDPSPNGFTPFQSPQHAYDAAANHIGVTQIFSQPAPTTGFWTTTTNRSQTYDGNGQEVKRVSTTQTNNYQPATTTTYYVRSSVLGGQVVAQLDGQGVIQSSFVIARGTVLATRTPLFGGNVYLVWEHPTPLTGDTIETGSTGGLTGATHMDPQGVDVGESDPFPNGADELFTAPADGTGKIAPIGFGGGRSKCVLDGLETDCGFIRAEAAAACPSNDCGSRVLSVDITLTGGRHVGGSAFTDPFSAYADGSSGFGVLGSGPYGFLLPEGFHASFSGQEAHEAVTSFFLGAMTSYLLRPQGKKKGRRRRVQRPDNGGLAGDSADVFKHITIERFSDVRTAQIKAQLGRLFTAQCADAFHAAKLRSPEEFVMHAGLVVRNANDLYNLSLARLGLLHHETLEYNKQGISDGAQGVTITPFQGSTQLTVDGRVQIYLAPSAWNGAYPFDEVIAHEAMHGGGAQKAPAPWWRFGPLRHDLVDSPHYKEMLAACK